MFISVWASIVCNKCFRIEFTRWFISNSSVCSLTQPLDVVWCFISTSFSLSASCPWDVLASPIDRSFSLDGNVYLFNFFPDKSLDSWNFVFEVAVWLCAFYAATHQILRGKMSKWDAHAEQKKGCIIFHPKKTESTREGKRKKEQNACKASKWSSSVEKKTQLAAHRYHRVFLFSTSLWFLPIQVLTRRSLSY